MNIQDQEFEPSPIQVLVTAASGFATAPGCSWLHGFCLLTCTQKDGEVTIDGQLVTGERFADDRPVIEALSRALYENAILAGLDMTDMVGRLGRLPIDSQDQRPALALLRRLRAMLVGREAIDLTLTERGQATMVLTARKHGLSLREDWVGERENARPAVRGGIDNGNPARLPVELVDTAGVCLLTIAELHLPELRAQIASGWRRWRSELQVAPPLPRSTCDEGQH